MADLTSTAEQVRLVQVDNSEFYSVIASVAITAGQVVYFNTSTGKADLADASVAGTATARGVALRTVGAGQAVTIVKRGKVAGFDLSAQSYDDEIFLSDTAGALADAAGTVSVSCGRVVPSSETTIQKQLYVDFAW